MAGVKSMLGWIGRGIVRRLGQATSILPFPAHRRTEEVSRLRQVAPPAEHPEPPRPEHLPRAHAEDPKARPQQHVNPAPPLEHGHPKR
jgi:hypothetical protein